MHACTAQGLARKFTHNFTESLSRDPPSLFSLLLSSSLGLPFLVLWPESWGFSYCILPPVSWPTPKSGAKQQEGRERTKQADFMSPSWDYSSFNQRGQFSFLSFRCPKAPLLPLALPPLPWGCLALGPERTKENNPQVPPVWAIGS